MSPRVVLWIAFLIVHVGVAAVGWLIPGSMGDVWIVYEPWSTDAVAGRGIVGVTESFVYPQLALVPMILAKSLSWIGGYIIAWALLVTALDAIAFAILVGRGRSRGRLVAAAAWLVGIGLLGPVGMYRIDAITVPLAVLGLLWLARRPAVGSALLAAGMWIKVWPVALLATAFVALRRRTSVLLGALAVSAVVIAISLALGGARHLFGFVGEQTGRGLQVEAPVSTFYLWRAALGIPGSSVFYDRDILTYQVTGPGAQTVIDVMTPLLGLAALVVVALGAVQAWRGATFVRLVPPLALALVLTLIVFNKVGSPQFQVWLIAPVVFWLVADRSRAWTAAGLTAVLLALTQVVYPFLYGPVLQAQPAAVLILTLRNVLSVVLLIVAVVQVARVPVRARAGQRPHTAPVADPVG